MSFEEVGRALDNALDAIAESVKTIVRSIKSQFRGNRYKAVHVTVCAKRRRQLHVKRSYIRLASEPTSRARPKGRCDYQPFSVSERRQEGSAGQRLPSCALHGRPSYTGVTGGDDWCCKSESEEAS